VNLRLNCGVASLSTRRSAAGGLVSPAFTLKASYLQSRGLTG
jgi:hypothetical protein